MMSRWRRAAAGGLMALAVAALPACSEWQGLNTLNLPGTAVYAKSSFSDIDTVTSPALSFTTLKSHGFSHVLPCSASGNVGKMPPYTIIQS